MDEFKNAIKMLEFLSDEELDNYFKTYINEIYSEDSQSLDEGVQELLKLAKILNSNGPSREKFSLGSVLNDLKTQKIIDNNTFKMIYSVLFQ